jgi:hypothetical protein
MHISGTVVSPGQAYTLPHSHYRISSPDVAHIPAAQLSNQRFELDGLE